MKIYETYMKNIWKYAKKNTWEIYEHTWKLNEQYMKIYGKYVKIYEQ